MLCQKTNLNPWRRFFQNSKKGCQIHLAMFTGSQVLSFGLEGAEIGFGTEKVE